MTVYYSVDSCRCPIGYEGPRCQMMKITFACGFGWVYLDPLSACEDDILRLEFMTEAPGGLLLYNGPMYDEDAADVPDFISIELLVGFPKLRINLGDGEIVLPSSGQAGLASLNDGSWHTVEVFKTGKVRINTLNSFH